MAISHPYPNPTDDPEFYCHGQVCIDGGCSPLACLEEDTPSGDEWDATCAAAITGSWSDYSYLDDE